MAVLFSGDEKETTNKRRRWSRVRDSLVLFLKLWQDAMSKRGLAIDQSTSPLEAGLARPKAPFDIFGRPLRQGGNLLKYKLACRKLRCQIFRHDPCEHADCVKLSATH